ncbi:hypothetical protein LNQ81_12875 [Myroides sp. M-43]|uniref:hypothetical protein n=1 Tax=Myroides oncorhynchi TaxID=2893756 RepID=UPI001E4D8E18|nr:hypothetical protein [Myroides oncorhynchi]MCC9043567.1 hypothetical protein [Myroides oncorhynchi]
MNTQTTKLVGIFGMILLLGTQNLKAQTFYGYVSAKEKSETIASDKVNRLIISNIFEVKFCKDYQVSLSNLERGTYEITPVRSIVKSKLRVEYDYGLKLVGYNINHHFADIKLFESYDKADTNRKTMIAEYKNDRYNPANSESVYISLECFK